MSEPKTREEAAERIARFTFRRQLRELGFKEITFDSCKPEERQAYIDDSMGILDALDWQPPAEPETTEKDGQVDNDWLIALTKVFGLEALVLKDSSAGERLNTVKRVMSVLAETLDEEMVEKIAQRERLGVDALGMIVSQYRQLCKENKYKPTAEDEWGHIAETQRRRDLAALSQSDKKE